MCSIYSRAASDKNEREDDEPQKKPRYSEQNE